MPREKTPVTDAQRAARRENILAFNKARGGRPAAKHGITSAIVQGGRVPPELPDAAEINAEVNSLVAQIIADLGGADQITANRRTIVAAQRTVLTVLALAQRYIAREGLVSRKGKPHPLLGLLVSYVNAARLNAVALGLERRARKIGPSTLAEYIESRSASSPETGEAPQ